MVDSQQQVLLSLQCVPINTEGWKKSYDMYFQSFGIWKDSENYMQNIDYLYDRFLDVQLIIPYIEQYVAEELTLDEALEQAEQEILFKLFE